MTQSKRYKAREGCILTVAGIRVTDAPAGVELSPSDLLADHVRMSRLVPVTAAAEIKNVVKPSPAKESSPAKPNKEPQS